MKFNQVNWKSAYEWLREKQALLVEVYIKGDILKVRHIQISILKDFRTTAIAVRRVTTSSGSRTPGARWSYCNYHRRTRIACYASAFNRSNSEYL